MQGDSNQDKNKDFYEKAYSDYSIKNILWWLNHLDGYLEFATTTETSWVALYKDNFREELEGKKVLEMGCGDCNNAAIMAALGAEVYANDIAAASGEIVRKLNENYEFKYPLQFIEGDFLHNNLPDKEFDFIIGKAFLHHLTVPVEKLFLKETARLLKPGGEARFFEPAVNSKILDELRWMVPVKNRPSKLNKKAFAAWKEEDPHPDRSFSSKHFEMAGKEFFTEVVITPIGSLERFGQLFNRGKKREIYRKKALKAENSLPYFVNLYFAKSQLIQYRKPHQKKGFGKKAV